MDLVLIRGLPGSGKSTMARSMVSEGYKHLEADMFLEDENGEYRYDPNKVVAAHHWCMRETFKALSAGTKVVVSNTFTQRFEVEPYFEIAEIFGIQPRIIEAKGNWGNVHGVPASVVDDMRKRWETI